MPKRKQNMDHPVTELSLYLVNEWNNSNTIFGMLVLMTMWVFASTIVQATTML